MKTKDNSDDCLSLKGFKRALKNQENSSRDYSCRVDEERVRGIQSALIVNCNW